MQKAIAKVNIDGEVETFVGALKSNDGDSIVLVLDSGGEMSFPKSDVEDLNITDEVIDLPEEPKAEAPKIEKTKVTGELKPLKVGSKLHQVVEICRANPNMVRKEQIALIMEQVGMTQAGASTYHQNAKPYLKQ
jgi:hypothetical protein